MAELKQLTAYNRAFLLVQSSDHITGLTAASCASIVVEGNKNNGGFTTLTAVVSEMGRGYYNAALKTSDTNTLGDLAFHITVASADATDFVDQVRGNILGDTLPANVTQWGSTSIATVITGGTPVVDTWYFKGTQSLGVAGYVGPDWANLTGTSATKLLGNTTINSSQSVVATVAINTDKTGYSLTQAFPSNFAAMAILAGGQIGLDWGNIARTSSTNILANTTINTSQTVQASVGSVNVTQWNGTNVQAPNVAGVPVVDVGYFRGTASAGVAGYSGVDWSHINAPTTAQALSGTTLNSSLSTVVNQNNDKTGYSLSGTVTTGTLLDKTGFTLTPQERGLIVASSWTTVQAESYAALHTVPTPIQAMLEMRAMMAEKTVTHTSVTLHMIDGATLAETFTIDDTSPTLIFRSA